MNTKFTAFGLWVASCVFCVQAGAFQLGDHREITNQAFTEFSACFPEFKDNYFMAALLDGDIHEDTDLLTKELVYSHYYNPRKKLDMLRADSSGRISDLMPLLRQCRATGALWSVEDLNWLGHAIHHVQDATVPAHVVPVSHSFWDGFESYELKGDISSGWSCAQLRENGESDLPAVLNVTAMNTLLAIKMLNVVMLNEVTGALGHLTGTAFWQESNDSSFGHYGVLGNAFGSAEIQTESGNFLVSDGLYKEFKRQQMISAVRATLKGLVWALVPQR